MGSCSAACCSSNEDSTLPTKSEEGNDILSDDLAIIKSVPLLDTFVEPPLLTEPQVPCAKQAKSEEIGARKSDESKYLREQAPSTRGEIQLNFHNVEPSVKERLEPGITRIKRLCSLGQLLDAYKALVEHEQFSRKSGCEDFDAQIQIDTAIVRLRMWQKNYLEDILPIIKMSTRSDVKYVVLEESVAKAGPHVRVRVCLRQLQNAERDPQGNSTQGVVAQEMMNIPIRFIDLATRMIEADLIDRTDLDSCVAYSGFPGGVHRFYRGYKRVLMAPIPLLKVYDDVISDVVSFPDPPPELASYGPGVLHYDSSLFDSSVDSKGCYDGFDILEKPRWGVRMTNVLAKYLTPSTEVPGTTNLRIFCKLSVPIPQWLLTEKLGASVLLKMAKGNTVKIAEFRQDQQKLDRTVRARERAPDLYQFLKQLDPHSGPA